MTSKQVMLTLVALLCAACSTLKRPGADPLVSPYAERRVWAIAPLRNESGSLQVDTAALADNLARQLENASNIDVVAVNRTLAAMEALGIGEVTSSAEAMRLLGVLDVDGLVVGTVTTYDPYDPPKLGMAIELYTSPRYEASRPVDPRGLTSAATPGNDSPTLSRRPRQPVSVVSAFFDAADPDVRNKMQRYAEGRRQTQDDPLSFIKPPADGWRLYRINMHLYSEFVSYVMSWRLLRAEHERLAPPPPPAPTTTTTASASAPEKQPAP